MMRIPLHGKLAKGIYALVDDDDYELVSARRWNLWDFNHLKYALSYVRTVDGKNGSIRMHRLILPDAVIVDHIDGDGLNNTKANLRAATHRQNLHNSSGWRNRKNKYKGTSFLPWMKLKPWRAAIRINKQFIHLGCFVTEEEAALAYDAASAEYHGAFYRPNTIPVKAT